ncbi:hypothetical protein GCM10010918_20160 [Paenibacillus radicis (ex Gao et al. 2016)]|uniref:Uncharacterized protein n=1 Tax=Paenibacillus radicis (ex Gao et al. 2016) TaxID=1737354 RepID=A0A917LYN9_9BACL|nr:hypothetical protein GCM10010918_20160 [Paenibacillus radicis (ex Gao et al. 2016)]
MSIANYGIGSRKNNKIRLRIESKLEGCDRLSESDLLQPSLGIREKPALLGERAFGKMDENPLLGVIEWILQWS